MTLNKKIWFKLSLLTLVLALGTACDETQVPEAETPVTTTTTTTYAAKQVDTATAGTAFGQVNHMAKSLNGSTLYVAEAARFSAISGAGVATTLTSNPDLSAAAGGAAGKADLSGKPAGVSHLSPSATGVLATIDTKHAVLFDGIAATNAWVTDGDTGATTDVAVLADGGSVVTAFMTVNDNLYLRDLHAANSARFLTGRGTSVLLNQIVTGATAFTNAGASKAFVASKGNKAFIVEPNGVYSLDDTNPVTVVVQNANLVAAATWAIKGKPAVVGGPGAAAQIVNNVNVTPTCVLLNNNKLYIGFAGTVVTGGVAIYNLNPGTHAITTFVPTSFADRDKNVVALTAHGNDVYAVLADKILKVVETTGEDDTAANVGPEVALVGDLSAYYGAKKADGTAGFHFNGVAGAPVGAVDMGSAVAAEFMGDDLYVGTNRGLFKFTKTTVTQ